MASLHDSSGQPETGINAYSCEDRQRGIGWPHCLAMVVLLHGRSHLLCSCGHGISHLLYSCGFPVIAVESDTHAVICSSPAGEDCRGAFRRDAVFSYLSPLAESQLSVISAQHAGESVMSPKSQLQCPPPPSCLALATGHPLSYRVCLRLHGTICIASLLTVRFLWGLRQKDGRRNGLEMASNGLSWPYMSPASHSIPHK